MQYGTNCFDYLEGQYNKFHVVLYAECSSPTISVQPVSGTICAGQFHQFCVTAAGTGQLGYQWQLNGAIITGATSSCYSASQAGSYRCLVSNLCGSLMSDAATLAVNTPPTIGTQLVDAAICSGQSHQLCIAASGAPPLSCQWQLNEGDIPEATAACYTAWQAGSYRCRVTNPCGSTMSNSATLTLLDGPTITVQPADGVVCNVQPHEMCVVAQGSGLLHFQWRRNSLIIIGANGDCYSATRAGTYTCVISDDCGPTLSTAAVVTVRGTGDLDGDADAADVPAFVGVLLGEDSDPGHRAVADANCDELLDGRDTRPFVSLLLGG